jgi:hypothetical protein
MPRLPRDVSRLLADVVSPGTSREGLELGLNVDVGLAVKPRRTEVCVGRSMARGASGNVTLRGAAGNDLRNSRGRVGMGSRLTRKI